MGQKAYMAHWNGSTFLDTECGIWHLSTFAWIGRSMTITDGYGKSNISGMGDRDRDEVMAHRYVGIIWI